MNTLQRKFLDETIANKGKNFQNIFTYMRKIEFPETDICQWDCEQFTETFVKCKPHSLQEVSSMIFATEEFLKWVITNGYSDQQRGIQELKKVNRQTVFYSSLEKNGVERKYISYSEYRKAMESISASEINDVYFRALLCAIYEGIYSDDMSVIMRLKASDINDRMVRLHNNSDESWDIEVSEECVGLLSMNARIQDYYLIAPRGGYREEKNFFGWDGSLDAVFKTGSRQSGANRKTSCRQSYCGIIRKMDVYFGRHVKPRSIFISGVMHRASLNLEKEGYSLSEAFVYRAGNREALNIVLNEFQRSNYPIDGKKLRENIKGHLSEF